ncbi:prolactin [Thalassophryne amazonica]|uniref:prolactin n=1 Tax=Thalassophryne amazonica TaxID=390379 RepID=UPI001470DDDA|nr:prolactin [Thalassophryne amazonica]
MAHKLIHFYIAVLLMMASCSCVPVNELLDRASERSDKLHALSAALTHALDSHIPPIGRVIMPRLALCHTSSLQTPNDKEQTLQVSDSDLLSLARSLLQAWTTPLVDLASSVSSLPHPDHNGIHAKVQELQEHSRTLGHGLDVLSAKMGPSAQIISLLPYRGDDDDDEDDDDDIGQNRISKLIRFYFLLSCFRRDSHKIDSFLKVIRCQAARMQPEMC